jgi:hypothetical protein
LARIKTALEKIIAEKRTESILRNAEIKHPTKEAVGVAWNPQTQKLEVQYPPIENQR